MRTEFYIPQQDSGLSLFSNFVDHEYQQKVNRMQVMYASPMSGIDERQSHFEVTADVRNTEMSKAAGKPKGAPVGRRLNMRQKIEDRLIELGRQREAIRAQEMKRREREQLSNMKKKPSINPNSISMAKKKRENRQSDFFSSEIAFV